MIPDKASITMIITMLRTIPTHINQ